jgi:hypothetical protein
MRRLVFALSVALLVGSFALSGNPMHAYGFTASGEHAQIAAPGDYRTVDWNRDSYGQEDHDFDRPVVGHCHCAPYYFDYYYSYPYPCTCNCG